MTTKIDIALARRFLNADGRRDGWLFARQHQNDLAAITAEIQDIEEQIADPNSLSGSMKPNAGPRIYSDGYLAALKEAVAIIRESDGEAVT
jgi:hypothetical protein